MPDVTAIALQDLSHLSATASRQLDCGGRMLIDGQFVDVHSKLPVINPSLGKVTSEICDARVSTTFSASRRLSHLPAGLDPVERAGNPDTDAQ